MKCLAAFIFFLISSLTNAQDNFLAYRVTGKVTYQVKNNQVPLKVGQVLDKTTSVSIARNARLLLICGNSSKAIELPEGKHSLTGLASSCHASEHSLTANYFNYVWWQLTHPGASGDEEQKRNRSGAGAASRGCAGIDLMTPDTLAFYKENITLRWKINAGYKTLEFVLYEYADSPVPLLKIPMKTNYLHVNKLKDKLEVSKDYFWTLRLDGKETCPRQVMQVWSADDFTNLTDSITSNPIQGVDAAEREYMTGWLYEQNHLNGEALRLYKRAAAAAPGNNRYKKTVKRLQL